MDADQTLGHIESQWYITGIVHPKIRIKQLITHPPCCTNPVRPSFIFGNTNEDIFD